MDMATSEKFVVEIMQYLINSAKTFAKERFKDLMNSKK